MKKLIILLITILIIFIYILINYKVIYVSNNYNKKISNELYITIDWEKLYLYEFDKKAYNLMNKINNIDDNFSLYATYTRKLTERQRKIFDKEELTKISLHYEYKNANNAEKLYNKYINELINDFWKPTYINSNKYAKYDEYIWIKWNNVLKLDLNNYDNESALITNYPYQVYLWLWDLREEEKIDFYWIHYRDYICLSLPCNDYIPFIFINRNKEEN